MTPSAIQKVLTVSIAAYNVEGYIEQTLEPFCNEAVADRVEVLIIDDGGTDRTLEIARGYQSRYPSTFVPVHKENGGWGSTVNTSIHRARGRYFKLLDGDDRFDPKTLPVILDQLEKTDVDLVYTPYTEFEDETNRIIRVIGPVADTPIGTVVDAARVADWAPLNMHASTFKTSVLQDHRICVLEHCFYTDAEYYIKALSFCRSALLLDKPLYQYRVGRNGQSVSPESWKKHYPENERVIKELIAFEASSDMSDKMRETVRGRIVGPIRFHYQMLSLAGCRPQLVQFDAELKQLSPLYYQLSESKTLKLFRRLKFYWCKPLYTHIQRHRQTRDAHLPSR